MSVNILYIAFFILIYVLLSHDLFFKIQVPSYVLMGIASTASFLPQTPLGEACSRMDLTAIHEILEKIAYKDDEGATNEVKWTS